MFGALALAHLEARATDHVLGAWQRGELAPPWRLHIGLLFAGWGAFNLVEGLVNHHILQIHRVRPDAAQPGRRRDWQTRGVDFHSAYDQGFARVAACTVHDWVSGFAGQYCAKVGPGSHRVKVVLDSYYGNDVYLFGLGYVLDYFRARDSELLGLAG